MLLPDLPSPEERVLDSVHAGQDEIEHTILGCLVPMLPVVPESTIRVVRGIRFNAPQVEAAIVEPSAVFPTNGDTEVLLAEKKSVNLQAKKARI